MEAGTLAIVIEQLQRRGFTASFAASAAGLRVLGSDRTLRADELTIREYRRFEGESDPDDLAVVYAIEVADGTRGTLVDAFGVYADPAVGALLEKVPVRAGEPEPRPPGSR